MRAQPTYNSRISDLQENDMRKIFLWAGSVLVIVLVLMLWRNKTHTGTSAISGTMAKDAYYHMGHNNCLSMQTWLANINAFNLYTQTNISRGRTLEMWNDFIKKESSFRNKLITVSNPDTQTKLFYMCMDHSNNASLQVKNLGGKFLCSEVKGHIINTDSLSATEFAQKGSNAINTFNVRQGYPKITVRAYKDSECKHKVPS